MRIGKWVLGVWSLAVVLGRTSLAQVTQRVSLSSAGAQVSGQSVAPSISADGRYVAFSSDASTLVPGDTNGYMDVFVRDRQTGTTERVSVGPGGVQGNNDSVSTSISADGRYVAFISSAYNLVPGGTYRIDAFVHDRQLGTTELVSADSAGAQGNDDTIDAKISGDGRYVSFVSRASNLVPGDTNGYADTFVRDRLLGTTERVSVDSAGGEGNGPCWSCSISADGRYVAFISSAYNLVPGDTNGHEDVFVRDRSTGTTERVSVDSAGIQQDQGSGQALSISADGRYVAFSSPATNLVFGDTNGTEDVFVRDRQAGTTERVSLDSAGGQGNGQSGLSVSISADGRYVAFWSLATNLVLGDTNGDSDDFVRDRLLGTTERVSVSSGGAQGNDWSLELCASADARYVAFYSSASNLVPGDTNGVRDIFVRDRLGGPSFTSLCDPGTSGVITCPCSNPPGGPGSGCDNSAATGGAVLAASGGTYLSSDSLVFTTSGEKPTATSILLQGTTSPPAGTVFGQGVSCVGGTLERLFTKAAAGGRITAPDFGAGDLTVSARSASRGDVIQPGQSRWYLVYYRDPTVLGGCPATSTFNATQTGRVDWSF